MTRILFYLNTLVFVPAWLAAYVWLSFRLRNEAYRVHLFRPPGHIRATHFCFTAEKNGKTYFVKIQNPLMRLYGTCMGRPQLPPDIKERVLSDIDRQPTLRPLFPSRFTIHGVTLFTFLDGYITLSAFLQEDPSRAGTIRSRIASGLDQLHAHGIIHGDVKSKNILVRPQDLDIKFVDLDDMAYMDAKNGRYDNESLERIFAPIK